MNRDELRLELLRLTYSHGRDASEAVTRAKELEAYVLEESKPAAGTVTGARQGVPQREPKGR